MARKTILDASGFVHIFTFELGEFACNVDVRRSTARNNSFFHCSTVACNASSLVMVLLLLHLHLGGSSDVKDCNATRQFARRS